MSDICAILKHRAGFDFHALGEDGDPFMAAAGVVVEWLLEKEGRYGESPVAADLGRGRAFPRAWDYASPEGYAGGDYDADEWPALACASLRNDEGDVVRWVVEYDEPDASHDDRRWHTTVCLDAGGPDLASAPCHVAVQVMCRPLANCAEPLPDTVAAPSLVRMLVELPWFAAKSGPTQLQAVPCKLSAQGFDDFAAALTSPERTLPFVLFCTGYNGKMPEQAKQLARRALGIANVYVVDWSNDELRAKELALFEKGTPAGEYACPKESARLYLPHVDLTNPHSSRQHTSWNREALQADRPSVFAEKLARRLLPAKAVRDIAALDEEPEALREAEEQ